MNFRNILLIVLVIAGLGVSSARAGLPAPLPIPADALARALQSDDAQVRAQAAEALPFPLDAAMLEPLAAAIRRPGAEEHVLASLYLAAARADREGAYPLISDCLEQQKASTVRAACIRALSTLRTQEAGDRLLALARESRQPKEQLSAISALGSSPGASTTAFLETLLAASATDLRQAPQRAAAIRALKNARSAEAGKVLAALLSSADGGPMQARETKDIVEALVYSPSAEAVGALKKLLAGQMRGPERIHAAAALARAQGGDLWAALAPFLEGDDLRSADIALRVLIATRDKDSAPRIAGLLHDWRLRLESELGQPGKAAIARAGATVNALTTAVWVASAQGTEAGVDNIAAIMRLDFKAIAKPGDQKLAASLDVLEARLKLAAARMLAHPSSPVAVAALLEPGAIAHRDPHVRKASLLSLGRQGAPAAISGIAERLKADDDPEARAAAAIALAMIGAPKAAPALIAALDDPAGKVRAMAAVALGILQHAPARERIAAMADSGGDAAARAGAAFALALLPEG